MNKISQLPLSACFLTMILVSETATSAHPGGLDRYGGHKCRTNCAYWGLREGQWHTHSGSTYSRKRSSSDLTYSRKQSSSREKEEKSEVVHSLPLPVLGRDECYSLQDLGFITYWWSVKGDSDWKCYSRAFLSTINPIESDSISYVVERISELGMHRNVLSVYFTGYTDREKTLAVFIASAESLLFRLGFMEDLLDMHIDNIRPTLRVYDGRRIELKEAKGTIQLSVEFIDVAAHDEKARVQEIKKRVLQDIERLRHARLKTAGEARRDLQRKMEDWHALYAKNIAGLKMAIVDLLSSLEGGGHWNASCRRVARETVLLRKETDLYTTPDKVVNESLQAVIRAFDFVVRYCSSGKIYETRNSLKKVETSLQAFAKSIEEYSLKP